MIDLKATIKKVSLQKVTAITAILVITIIGVHLLYSHAQTPSASIVISSGKVVSPASVVSDNTAIGGSAVIFRSASTAPLAVHVSGGQLVDGNGKVIRLLGIDVPGTESGCVSNSPVITYNAPVTQATADAISSWKINAVRVPLNEDCWLGINGVSPAVSAQAYQAAIKQWVTYLHNDGIIAILDLHFAAPATVLANSEYPMADEDHSPTFWQQVASAYKSDPAVIFDLFNEPYIGNTGVTTTSSVPNWTCWLNGCTVVDNHNTNITYTTAGMQQLVDTVRSTGATQPIMVGGLNYAGDPCGISGKLGSNAACPEVANMPSDSQNNLIVSYHNYYDPNVCTTDSCWVSHWNAELGPIKAANMPMVNDEFGEDDCSTGFMTNYMNWADQNNGSYLAWAWKTTTSTSCTTGSSGLMNYALLNDYSGNPSTLIQQGSNYKNHLAAVSPY